MSLFYEVLVYWYIRTAVAGLFIYNGRVMMRWFAGDEERLVWGFGGR